MSFNLLKNYCVVLDKNLKFTSFESISFHDGFWDSERINPRWLFDKFSPDQRSHLRNAYIEELINTFYVENDVVRGELH